MSEEDRRQPGEPSRPPYPPPAQEIDLLIESSRVALDEMRAGPQPVDPRIIAFLENVVASLIAHSIDLSNLYALHQAELEELRTRRQGTQ